MAETAAKERRILVAVDEGEESMYALSWCLKNVISKHSKDTLVLLYAKPLRAFSALDGTGYLFSADLFAKVEKSGDDMADIIMEKAKKMCSNEVNGVEVETRIENGDPKEVICSMVERLGVDVLVMGSHGYGPLKRAFVGSVSNHCAQHVKCPVLVVKKTPAQSAAA